MTVADTSTDTVLLRHNRIDLALHLLRPEPLDTTAPSRPLLLLHGLGDRSPATAPAWVAIGPDRSQPWTSPATANRRARRAAGTPPRR